MCADEATCAVVSVSGLIPIVGRESGRVRILDRRGGCWVRLGSLLERITESWFRVSRLIIDFFRTLAKGLQLCRKSLKRLLI